MYVIELYSTQEGEEPVSDFLDSLPPKLGGKTIRTIELLEKFGISLREPHVKHIEDDLWELRTKFASNITRILYFMTAGDKFVLLHGFIKKTDKLSLNEKKTAMQRMEDYRRRCEV